jgi:hypothetical protein
MCHNACILSRTCVRFISFRAIAEAPERVEEVSIDILHNMIKEQGTASTITEDV